MHTTIKTAGVHTLEDATITLHTRELQDVDQSLESFRFRWWAWPVAALAGFFLLGFGSMGFNPYPSDDEAHTTFIGAMAFVGAGAGIALYAGFVMVMRRMLRSSKRQIEFQLLKARAEQLKESIEEDFFTKLVKINFRYIDQYYYQTQQQANKSFRLSAVAATVGFGIVIVGIVMMFWGIAQPAYVTTAVGLISEFVSAVFFYLYNRTILKMGEYHEKLVLTQNISVALKIAEGLPEKARIQSQQTLIERLTQDVNLYLSDNPVIPEAK